MPKVVIEYQPKDQYGTPVGPLQKFEGDSYKEIAEKLRAAHENASLALYEARKRNKFGELLDTDPEQPIYTFEPRELTADDRVRIFEALKDPATQHEALRELLEAELGAPLEEVRKDLRERQLEKRAQENAYQVDLFLKAHPEYIPTEKNSELIQKYLLKHELGVTKKNLEAAFEELKADGLLTLRVPEPAKEETPQVSSASDSTEEKKEKAAEAGAEAAPVEPVVENTPAPPVPVYVPGALLPKDIFAMTASEYETWFRSGGKVLPASLEETIKSRPVDPNLRYLTAEEIGKISQDEYDVWYRSNGKVAPASLATIPAETTVAAPISEQPSEVRTSKLSSSGLSAEHSSVKNRAPSAPKTKGITIQEINAMDSREYERRLADPEFRAAVEELFKK